MRRLLNNFPVFHDFHAAAILGNIGRETGGFRLMQEVRPRSGRGGLGWLQWTGPRRVDFEQFCQPPNPSTATDEGNYTFMVHEMRGKEHQARELFEVTTNWTTQPPYSCQNTRGPASRRYRNERISRAAH